MKFLIIPCLGTLAKDREIIYDALEFALEKDYARHFRENAQWCEADSSNPYVEIKIPEGNEDEKKRRDNSWSNLD